MAMAEPPITRRELREELTHYATKADLAEVRGDIKALRVLMVATISGVGLFLGGLNIILQLIG